MAPDAVETSHLSIESALDERLFADPGLFDEVGRHLRAGSLCIIRNAFRRVLADEMFDALDQVTAWPVHDAYLPNFSFHHHNLYDFRSYPAPLHTFGRMMADARTKAFAEKLTGRDCAGEPVVSASYYMPGDYSLPHDDTAWPRQVAWVWNLTRDWDPRWGGQFVWCSPYLNLTPAFNTLVLFNAEPSKSIHFVAHVSPTARAKRLAVNGWWTASPAAKPSARAGSGAKPVIIGEGVEILSTG